MKKVDRKWDFLSKEKRASCINEIITYFKEEREEKIGIIAAESILDFLLQGVGGDIYNKGIDDSKKTLQKNYFYPTVFYLN